MTDQAASRAAGAERIAEELKRAILRRELQPGQQVRQSEWASRLHVSLVPLREALKVLSTQNILRYDSMRGYSVTYLDDSQIDQLYRLRILIETEIFKSIRWPSSVEIESLTKTVNDSLEMELRGEVEAADELSKAFVFTLWELSPLDMFIREAKSLWELTAPYRRAKAALVRDFDPTMSAARTTATAFLSALARHDREALIDAVAHDRSTLAQAMARIQSTI